MNSHKFKRRRDYYKIVDEKRRVIKVINSYKYNLNLIEKIGVFCLMDSQGIEDNLINSFNQILKTDYENKLDRFIYNIIVAFNNFSYQKNKNNLKNKFLQFYKVRTAGLPNMHILFWLKLVDFQVIWSNFVYFTYWIEDEEFDEKLVEFDEMDTNNKSTFSALIMLNIY